MSHIYIDEKSRSDKNRQELIQEFLKTLLGKTVAISFVDVTGAEPEPVNMEILGIHFEDNRLVLSIPLDKVFGVDETLY